MDPINYDSAYNSSLASSISLPDLGNTPTSFVIESTLNPTTKTYSPQNYVALTDTPSFAKLDKGSLSNVQVLPKPDLKPSFTKEGFENNHKLQFEVISQEPDFVAKFYLGSITVVGLYIFYRIMVKNK
jgi:hypothetical protein